MGRAQATPRGRPRRWSGLAPLVLIATVGFTSTVTATATATPIATASASPAASQLPVRPASAGTTSDGPATVSCPELGAVSISVPGNGPAAAVNVPAGVRVSVGFAATVVRTGAAVSGGARSGLTCSPLPFAARPAALVAGSTLPVGVAPGDLLTGVWVVTVTIDAPAPAGPRPQPLSAAAEPTTQAFAFAGSISAYLAGRPGNASVAVFDAVTGTTYGFAPASQYVTASIVKVDILTTLLRQTRLAGRDLTSAEQDTAALMIRYSDNDAADTLWNEVGQGSGVAAVNTLVPMPATTMGPGGLWGLTSTTAVDQVQLVKQVAYPSSVLGADQRSYLEGLMRSVAPDQRWGVSAGVPAGVSVALKNGWLPRDVGGWEINSVGHIVGAGHDYVIGVLSFGSPTMSEGVDTVQGISTLVWQGLPAANAVAAKYAALGGAGSFLGTPVGSETVVGAGVQQAYQHGVICWSAATGAHELHGAILGEYLAIGGLGSFAGLPVTDEVGTPDGSGRVNHFSNGASIYWTPATGAHELHGAIRDRWAANGWEAGPAGYPTTDEMGTPDGIGRYNHFSKGASIYWSPASGAHQVQGAVRNEWAAAGWETGPAGYPTTDETGTPDGMGRYNHFTKDASIYWSPASGVHEVHGAIRAHWAELGWEAGLLGYPVSDVVTTPDTVGRFAVFQGGSVYVMPGAGAHEVHGAIRDKWSALGWETGLLGYPLTDELTTPGGAGRSNRFQGGAVYWSPGSGTHEVHGAILTTYEGSGGPSSALGFPTTDEYAVPGGLRSDFQGGFATVDLATGTVTVTRR